MLLMMSLSIFTGLSEIYIAYIQLVMILFLRSPDLARLDIISGADINSICQEVNVYLINLSNELNGVARLGCMQ